MQYRFSYRAQIPGWPKVLGQLWPVEEYLVTFQLHGQEAQGMLHHVNAKTAWVRFKGRVIKRHLEKYKVRY